MKWRSKKGTVINIPDGLDPKQIKAIKADADSGYGTRAQETATKLGKKLANKPAPVTGAPVVEAPAPVEEGPNTTIDPKTGQVKDPDTLIGEAGHTFDPNDPYFQNLYKDTYNNTYGLATQGLDERKARELEDAQQEAAARGIPYDPGNRESAYGRAMGGVNDRYDQQYQAANQQAYQAANAAYEAQGGLANQGFATYMQGAQGISAAEAAAEANRIAKYGINKDYAAKMAAIKKSGGGGSSGGGNGGGQGFQII